MTPYDQSDLKLGHGTHPGETGKNNEDNYSVSVYHADDGGLITLGVVADGVGGRRAGEVASSLVVKTITDAVAQSQERDYKRMLELAVVQAAFVMAEEAKNPDYFGMASTCAIALVAGRKLYTAYVGDSRLYFVHNGLIRQTSVDHTWIQEAIEHGILTRDEAKDHPNKHVLRRHLGKDANVRPDFRLRLYDSETPAQAEKNQGLELEPGDRILICSDGLSDLVEPEEISEKLLKQEPQAAVDALILLARARGGHDNITVIALQVPE